MYNSHNNDRGRRDNDRRSSYENEYNNRNRNQYSNDWRRDADRSEDDRYHNSSYGRRREEDNYGPFSNIYSKENTDRNRNFNTHYNDKNNYYYGNGPVNDHSDEARGMSFGDLFNGRKRNQSDTDYYYNSGYHGEDRENTNRYDNRDDYRDYDRNRNYNSYNNQDDRRFNNQADNNQRDERDYREEDRYLNMRDYSDRDKSYNGYSTDYTKRRRHNEEGYRY